MGKFYINKFKIILSVLVVILSFALPAFAAEEGFVQLKNIKLTTGKDNTLYVNLITDKKLPSKPMVFEKSRNLYFLSILYTEYEGERDYDISDVSDKVDSMQVDFVPYKTGTVPGYTRVLIKTKDKMNLVLNERINDFPVGVLVACVIIGVVVLLGAVYLGFTLYLRFNKRRKINPDLLIDDYQDSDNLAEKPDEKTIPEASDIENQEKSDTADEIDTEILTVQEESSSAEEITEEIPETVNDTDKEVITEEIPETVNDTDKEVITEEITDYADESAIGDEADIEEDEKSEDDDEEISAVSDETGIEESGNEAEAAAEEFVDVENAADIEEISDIDEVFPEEKDDESDSEDIQKAQEEEQLLDSDLEEDYQENDFSSEAEENEEYSYKEESENALQDETDIDKLNTTAAEPEPDLTFNSEMHGEEIMNEHIEEDALNSGDEDVIEELAPDADEIVLDILKDENVLDELTESIAENDEMSEVSEQNDDFILDELYGKEEVLQEKIDGDFDEELLQSGLDDAIKPAEFTSEEAVAETPAQINQPDNDYELVDVQTVSGSGSMITPKVLDFTVHNDKKEEEPATETAQEQQTEPEELQEEEYNQFELMSATDEGDILDLFENENLPEEAQSEQPDSLDEDEFTETETDDLSAENQINEIVSAQDEDTLTEEQEEVQHGAEQEEPINMDAFFTDDTDDDEEDYIEDENVFDINKAFEEEASYTVPEKVHTETTEPEEIPEENVDDTEPLVLDQAEIDNTRSLYLIRHEGEYSLVATSGEAVFVLEKFQQKPAKDKIVLKLNEKREKDDVYLVKVGQWRALVGVSQDNIKNIMTL